MSDSDDITRKQAFIKAVWRIVTGRHMKEKLRALKTREDDEQWRRYAKGEIDLEEMRCVTRKSTFIRAAWHIVTGRRRREKLRAIRKRAERAERERELKEMAERAERERDYEERLAEEAKRNFDGRIDMTDVEIAHMFEDPCYPVSNSLLCLRLQLSSSACVINTLNISKEWRAHLIKKTVKVWLLATNASSPGSEYHSDIE